MNLEELGKRIKRLKQRTGYKDKAELLGIRQTIEAIESLCKKEEDGLEVYENRHAEGKGDGIWINAEDLIKLKIALNFK
ncbi:hypothetical protein LCGC14_2741950 [marine sediment metagenome]|uniref:Uncharacterized protein n=1 Tax=marine sediment metagenome TaxID=412755 RepID=A0A0F8XYT4_9ZZZZ